jgi:tetratricopeptide (TPR) repeat protein
MAVPSNLASIRMSPELVREQLARILASRVFLNVDRLKRFLEFIVNETLENRGDQLKEYPIGIEVFEKDSSFDSRTDPIVRVQARRLRARLSLYYAQEGVGSPVIIHVPKGSYTPVFLTPDETPTHVEPVVPRQTLVVDVRPFTDNTPSADYGWFARGLREEIVHQLLANGPAEIVVQAGDPETQVPAAIAIEGGLRVSGSMMRITWRLIDAATGRYQYSSSLDAPAEETLRIQEETAREILKALEANMRMPASVSSRRTSRRHSEAWNLCLQGRYHSSHRTEASLRRAAEFFEKAIAHDPLYAPAYSGLADAYALMCHYGAVDPSSMFTRVSANAVHAVALDDQSAETHTSLAHVKATQDWDWKGAAKEFLQAIALDPEYPLAHHWYAMSCLVPQGKLDEALAEMHRAQALDPVSSIISRDIAVLHYFKRDFGAALDQCDRTIEQNPHFSGTYWILGLVQARRGEFDEAIAACERALQLSPDSTAARGELGHMFAQAGRRENARSILGELEEQSRTSYVPPFKLSLIQFELGNWDQAFELLNRARAERSFELTYLSADPRFDFLRKEPRFTAFIRQLGLG